MVGELVSDASMIGATVRLAAAIVMLPLMSSRMRASRELPLRPPMTTATRCRPLRFTEVTRLKPDAVT